MGFLAGFTAPLRGGSFILRSGLVGYLAVPFVLNGALAGGAWMLAAAVLERRSPVRNLAGSYPSVASLLAHLGGLFLATVAFLVLQPVVSAPFCDRVSERVEMRLGRLARGPGLARGLLQASLHGLAKVSLYCVVLALGALITLFVPGAGAAMTVMIGAVFLAYDGFDYPLARRGFGFWGKWRYLFVHPGLTLGYGFGVMLLYLLPLSVLVMPQVAAVGATLAYLGRDNAEGAPGTDGGNET